MPPATLVTLAAELKNHIYELSFTVDKNEDTTNLLAPTPPSKNLLLTCQQINSEARGLYKQAYKDYWTTTHFTMKLDIITMPATSAQARISALRTDDLQHIEHLVITSRIRHPRDGGSILELELIDRRGAWRDHVAKELIGYVILGPTSDESEFYDNEEDMVADRAALQNVTGKNVVHAALRVFERMQR